MHDPSSLDFTARETEIMLLLSRGKDAVNIALALGLHKDVVTKYITVIATKLRLPSHQSVAEFAKLYRWDSRRPVQI